MMELKDFGYCIGSVGSETIYVCPKCNGKLYCNVDKRLYHCFSCGFSGKLNSTVTTKYVEPVVDLETQLKVAYWIHTNCKLNEQGREYLKSRKLYIGEDVGFRSIPIDLKYQLTKEFGLDNLKKARIIDNKGSIHFSLGIDRLFFPYWCDGQIKGFKTRDMGDSEFKYSILPGSNVHKFPFQWHKIYGDLIFTEGEFKSLVAGYHGYNCVSLPGINPSVECLKKAKQIRERYLRRPCYLLLDYDPRFYQHYPLLTATLKLAKELNLIVVELPGQDSKLGLDDFLLNVDERLTRYLDYSSIHQKMIISKIKYHHKLCETKLNHLEY